MKYNVLARDTGSALFHPAAYAVGETHSKIKKLLKIPLHQSFFRLKNREGEFIFNPDFFLKEEKRTLKLLENQKFFRLIEKKSLSSFSSLLKEVNKIKNPEKLSDKKLSSAIQKIFDLWVETIIYGHIINLSDFHFSLLSNKLLKELEKIKEKNRKKFSVGKTFSKLTVLKKRTLIQQQEIDFFKLLSFIQKNNKTESLFRKNTLKILEELKNFPKIKKKIQVHKKKYDWIEFHYDGPTILDERYFVESLSNFVKQDIKGKEKLKEIEKNFKNSLKERKKTIKKLKLNKKTLYWFDLAQSFMYLKALRKEVVFQVSRKTHPLILESAKRLSVSPTQIRHATPKEISAALKKGKISAKLLNERIKHCIVIGKNNQLQILSGKQALKLSRKVVEEKVKNVNEFTGNTAYPGFVRGLVKVIQKPSDMKKMKERDVLVSSATNPNLLPAMKKASVIITDEGGITCHAAIVSRELNIPCVIGTRIATKLLKDGFLVEVNATHAKIRILKKG